MDKELIFTIVSNVIVTRKIISDFTKQLIWDDEIKASVKIYDFASVKEALSTLEALFKAGSETRGIYKDESVIPRPGFQRNTIAFCDVDMEPMGGLELLRLCAGDEVLREITFIMLTQKPDIAEVSQLGELGAFHILVKPLALNKFSQTVLRLVGRIFSEEQRYYHEVERLLFQREYEKALKLIKDAESKYSSLRWVILRGRAYLGLNETQEAASNFTEAEMGSHVASVIALNHLVSVYEAIGDTENTISSLSKLTQKSPNNIDRKLKLAELYTERNRFDESKEVLITMIKDRLISTEMKIRIARLFEKAGCTAEAATIEMELVEDNVDDYVLCNELAISLRRRGQFELAEESYLKILKAHPEEAVIWFNRGINLGSWGKKESDARLLRDAEESFRKSLKLDPSLSEASDAIMTLKAERRSREKAAG